MPAELPGFYWDEARNRYFPLSSRPKQPQPPPVAVVKRINPTPENEIGLSRKRKRAYDPWDANESRRSAFSDRIRLRNSHEILCSQYASTSRMTPTRVHPIGSITAFCMTKVGGHDWQFIGDDRGWLYSERKHLPNEPPRFNLHSTINLQASSTISSICVSGSYCVASCFGAARLSVQDLNIAERTYLMTFNTVVDIRASHLQQKELVLGTSKRIIYIPDIDIATTFRSLRTNSDVFSVIQRDHLIYAGLRNGTLERYDTRVPDPKPVKLFEGRFGKSGRSPLLHINVLRENELLLSQMNGDISTFDLRFSPTSSTVTPIQIFEGHVNNYRPDLGIAIDQEHDLLFAAGAENRIRGWSLRTGAPFSPPPPPATPCSPDQPDNPFTHTFPSQVCALQVTEEGGKSGTCLWASCDKDLYQFHLGQRGIMEND
ncbi:hypothetical protein NLJ89_g5207 [Agrocybe chaxingu]|uniref:WD40 repeat-like protein n=1 Tax=Agrocybe chaxingu TaxID=84603 RepID=A0A9W8K182_9AGAR|nr:hypothetical protein NLJ89_g5207 [Agrocybe chaxingu]